MTFGAPGYLWLLVLIALLAAAGAWWLRWRSRARNRFVRALAKPHRRTRWRSSSPPSRWRHSRQRARNSARAKPRSKIAASMPCSCSMCRRA
jgi:hypothetical protein